MPRLVTITPQARAAIQTALERHSQTYVANTIGIATDTVRKAAKKGKTSSATAQKIEAWHSRARRAGEVRAKAKADPAKPKPSSSGLAIGIRVPAEVGEPLLRLCADRGLSPQEAIVHLVTEGLRNRNAT